MVRRHGLPLLLVHGNNDTLRAVEEFRRAGVTIHRQEREVAGVRFVGFGGDGTAPHDSQLAPGETLTLDLAGAILLTHLPPRGLHYVVHDQGAPVQPGAAPRAHVCGHVHHTEGIAWLGPTKVVKLRAAMWNRCALLDLDTLAATFLDLAPGAPRASEA